MSVPTRPLLLLITVCALALPGPGQAPASTSGIDPSDEEQLGIYEINLARHDPAAYGARIGVDLSTVDAQPPLAVNRHLTASARFHVEEMRDYDYFAHTSQVTGDGPNQMAVDHGYDLFGDGLAKDWGTNNYIESLAYGYNLMRTFEDAIAALIEDNGVPSLGHRIHLLGMSSWFTRHREIGCGRATSGSRRYYAVHTGYVSDADAFATGVVYDDANDNGRYDLGEGIGGVTVDVGGRSATTMSAGGYSIPVDAGAWTVTCVGGAFGGPSTAGIVVSGDNVEVDFRRGFAGGDVDFVPATEPPPPPPPPPDSDAEIVASILDGLAPLDVTFSADVDDPGLDLSWDLGDGGTSTAPALDHLYSQPGVYPVVLQARDGAQTTTDFVVVAVGGADGAGPGTTAPTSNALETTKLKAKVRFDRTGSDKIKLKAKLTMPTGFVAGTHRLEICVGPLRVPFTIDDRGKAEDIDGNKVSLKFDRPKDGSPLTAGVTAKLKIKLRGDLAARLEACGLRNEDGHDVLEDFPLVVLLNDLPYRGAARVSVDAARDDRATAKLLD